MSQTLTLHDIKNLPKPQVFDELDFNRILAERKSLLNSLQPLLFDHNQQACILPAEYIEDDTGKYWRIPAAKDMGLLYLELDSDPSVKQLEIASYLDLIRANKINRAARSHLLSFNTGAELDHVAADNSIKRLKNESDDALLQRILLTKKGKNPGTLDYYELAARSAAAGIRDVQVNMVGEEQDAVINITIMAESEKGEASEALIHTIYSHLHQKHIKLNNDVLDVNSVKLIPVILPITLYPYDDALPNLLTEIERNFRENFEQHRGLGIDINRSWITAQHQVTGIERVGDLALRFDYHIEKNECAYLKTYSVNEGRRQA